MKKEIDLEFLKIGENMLKRKYKRVFEEEQKKISNPEKSRKCSVVGCEFKASYIVQCENKETSEKKWLEFCWGHHKF